MHSSDLDGEGTVARRAVPKRERAGSPPIPGSGEGGSERRPPKRPAQEHEVVDRNGSSFDMVTETNNAVTIKSTKSVPGGTYDKKKFRSELQKRGIQLKGRVGHLFANNVKARIKFAAKGTLLDALKDPWDGFNRKDFLIANLDLADDDEQNFS